MQRHPGEARSLPKDDNEAIFEWDDENQSHGLRYEDMNDEDVTPDGEVTVVECVDEIPHFMSEEEAAQWWHTHSLDGQLWNGRRRGPPEGCAEQAAVERLARWRKQKTGFSDTPPQEPAISTDDAEPALEVSNTAGVAVLTISIAVVALLVVGFVLYEALKRARAI